MQLTAKHFRAIESATIEPSPVALVAGLNGAGKSSLLEAAAAALTRTPRPYLEAGASGARATITNAEARELLRDGQSKGAAQVADNDGVFRVNYPGLTTAGDSDEAPWASIYAAGLLDFPELPADKRAAALLRLLGAEATREDLARASPDAHTDQIDEAWGKVEAEGWEAAEAHAREEASRARGRWELATGERYGSAKAKAWAPEGWNHEELANKDADAAAKMLEEAAEKEKKAGDNLKAAQDAAAAANARSEQVAAVSAEIERLENELAEAHAELDAAREAANAAGESDPELAEEEKRLQREIDEIRGELAAMTPREELEPRAQDAPFIAHQLFEAEARAANEAAAHDADCPDCGAPLTVKGQRSKGFSLYSARSEAQAEVARLDAELDAAHEAAERLEQDREWVVELSSRLSRAEARLEEVQKAQGGADPEAARKASERLGAAQGAVDQKTAVLEEVRGRLAELQDAAAQATPDPQSEVSTAEALLEEAAQAHRDARALMDAIEAFRAARGAAAQAAGWSALGAALGDGGVRTEKLLATARAWAAGDLSAWAATAGWGPVGFTDDLEPTLGGRRYTFLSQSDRYKVRALLRIGWADRDESDAVILDGADVLDQSGRNGLFALIAKVAESGPRFLVGLTANRPDLVPDLSGAGLGTTYWVEAGTVTAKGDVAAA